jgi:hypothetical protein
MSFFKDTTSNQNTSVQKSRQLERLAMLRRRQFAALQRIFSGTRFALAFLPPRMAQQAQHD